MSSTAPDTLVPLTPVQEGMLLRQLRMPQRGDDVQQLVATVDEPINVDAFRAAWMDLANAHPVLRTRFQWEGMPEPRQALGDAPAPAIVAIDLTHETDAAQEAHLAAFLKADRVRGFALDRDPPCRVALFRLRDDRTTWVWTFPHIILDGSSFPHIVTDLYTAYDARCAGRSVTLPSRPSCADFLTWLPEQLTRNRDSARHFFAQQLEGFSSATTLCRRAAHTPPTQPADRLYTDTSRALSAHSTRALRALAQQCDVTMSTMVTAAWSLALSDFAGGDDDVVFGTVRRGRTGTVPHADDVLGMFVHTLPLRVAINATQPLRTWLGAIRQQQRALRPYEHTSLADIQASRGIETHDALFDSIVVFNTASFRAQLPQTDAWQRRHFTWIEQTNFPLTLYAYDGETLQCTLSADPTIIDNTVAADMVDRVMAALNAFAAQPDALVGELSRVPAAEHQRLAQWNATQTPVPDRLVHEWFEAQVALRPNATALVYRQERITYATLNTRANALAQQLQQLGVGPERCVAIYLERGIEMVVAMLATLKAGGAYLPLDPGYPAARIATILEDGAPHLLLTDTTLRSALPSTNATIVTVDAIDHAPPTHAANVVSSATPSSLAYMIFTSGSTGRPKGVLIEHRQVANFFVGMDAQLGTEPGVWLAVTSMSFDISVLELLWTLGRGYTVVVHDDLSTTAMQRRAASAATTPMQFSLFYFAADAATSGAGASGAARYRLLLDGARFADTHDFTAVWTPERHFHAFGGLYPNPAVTSAALATITTNVQLRAGSVVLPLHNPLRVAEEWAVVDNLSNGRVGLSFASGWHTNDFVLAPEQFEQRKAVMFDGINTIKRLWRGESIDLPNGSNDTIPVHTLPRPVQAEPPVWIATAGSTATFEMTGTIGANVLTNMLGQSLADLETRITAYRTARRAAGHTDRGHVTVMLHTFVGTDLNEVKRIVREPFMHYLRTSTDLVRQAHWEFPAFAPRTGAQATGAATAVREEGPTELSPDDEAALMEAAFERYVHTHGLFGTPESCRAMVDRLQAIGVDEIACLIDFGVDDAVVLANLEHLDTLRASSHTPIASTEPGTPEALSVGALMQQHGVTHLQCTPTLAQTLLHDPDMPAALNRLRQLLVGGEVVPDALAHRVQQIAPSCGIMNMYGPTETTVWSTTATLSAGSAVTIGRPIANTAIYLLDRQGALVPPGVVGELCIAGHGVARGYHNAPHHTAERFVMHHLPHADAPLRLYHTGDYARWNPDGSLTFAGRRDDQHKIRGHRIECGDIESALRAHPAVAHAAVVVRADTSGNTTLLAYVSPRAADKDADALERTAHWRDIWAAAYEEGATADDVAFNVAGWASSTTGEPLPRDDMREWVDHTVNRIRQLRPSRILSIGCGTGLLLFKLAPLVSRYTGVDYAASALDNIRRGIAAYGLTNVELINSPAHDLDVVDAQAYDVVVLNSVIQYFPSAEYLRRVLHQALAKLAPGGALFIGDVRDLQLLDAFYTDTELARSAPTMSLAAFRTAVDQRRARESELIVAPQFFEDFAFTSADVDGVSVELKHTRAQNEMTAFRYDVVLRKASPSHDGLRSTPDDLRVVDGHTLHTLDALRAVLANAPQGVRVVGLRNRRVIRATQAALRLQQLAHRDDATRSVADLAVPLEPSAGFDPADVYAIDDRFDVTLRPSIGSPERFDAIVLPRTDEWRQRPAMEQREVPRPANAAWIREPHEDHDQRTLPSALRAHLAAMLPAFMLPDDIVVLDRLPTTPNGKIDRQALPQPDARPSLPARNEPAVLPHDDTERTILRVWQRLLGREHVGVHDNFFDLGANSLLMMQANSALRHELGIPLPLVQLFAHPTIASLAQAIRQTATSPGTTTAAARVGEDRAQARRARLQQRRDD